MLPNIIFSCVVDTLPKFRWQCTIFINTLIHLAGVDARQIYVHIIESAPELEKFLQKAGVNIVFTQRWGDGKYCNKLSQFDTYELSKADFVFLCDCDLAFAGDVRSLCSEYYGSILGKTVDAANPPLKMLEGIFKKYNIKIPDTVETFAGNSFVTNFNGGILGIPGDKFSSFGEIWRFYAGQLLKDKDTLCILDKWSHHIDQISFSMALSHSTFSFQVLSTAYNAPTHSFVYQKKCNESLHGKEPLVLHYHSSLSDQGLLKSVGYPLIDNAVEKINQLISKEFNNNLFLDFRSSTNLEKDKEVIIAVKINPPVTSLISKSKQYKPSMLFVHIGSPKTGSTAIQHFIKDNRHILEEAGLTYPESASKAMNYLAFSLLDTIPELVHRLPVDMNELYANLEYGDKSNLISSEAFFSCSSSKYLGEALPSRLKLLLPEAYNVKIILYLRRQDNFIASIYAQYIKLHAHNSFYTKTIQKFIEEYAPYMDYYEILNNWSQIFGKENIIVRVYEKNQLKDGDIVSDFSSILGLHPMANYKSPPENVNPAIGRDELEFKRLINILSLNSNLKLNIIPKLLLQRSVNNKYFQDQALLSPCERIKLLDKYDEGNQRIAKEFLDRKNGKLFLDTPPAIDDPWQPYNGLTKEMAASIFSFLQVKSPELFLLITDVVKKDSRSTDNLVASTANWLNNCF